MPFAMLLSLCLPALAATAEQGTARRNRDVDVTAMCTVFGYTQYSPNGVIGGPSQKACKRQGMRLA